MPVQRVINYSPNFTAKEPKYIQVGSKLVPVHKVSATPASEPPKTFLEKVGYGVKYIIGRLYYYCFCK